MALGLGEGSEIRAPMGVAVIGGLITSTLLTLLVVPVFYSGLEGVKKRVAMLFGIQQHTIVAAGHSACRRDRERRRAQGPRLMGRPGLGPERPLQPLLRRVSHPGEATDGALAQRGRAGAP